jgi:hypothetical protein
MAASEEMKIVLQVGTELRVNNKGEVVVSNPELELAREDRAPTPFSSITSTPIAASTCSASSTPSPTTST